MFEDVEVVPVDVNYTIRKWVESYGTRYDWVTDAGDESDEYFDSVEKARKDFQQKKAIAKAVHAGITEWFKTATPEQIHELIFEPYEAFKKENR